jgi:hypothetical protein
MTIQSIACNIICAPQGMALTGPHTQAIDMPEKKDEQNRFA